MEKQKEIMVWNTRLSIFSGELAEYLKKGYTVKHLSSSGGGEYWTYIAILMIPE